MLQEKILIVDDEPYVLDICRRILENAYQVKIVGSGFEAVQLAYRERFDLLLTDIKMPGMDGLETVRALKRISPDTVCVTMTGYSTMETAIKALRLGIDEFVVKPFAPEELSLAVERALEKERLRKENIRLKSLLPLFEFNKLLLNTVATEQITQRVLNSAIENTEASAGGVYIVSEASTQPELAYTTMTPDQILFLEDHISSLLDWVNRKEQQLVFSQAPKDSMEMVLQGLPGLDFVVTPLLSKQRLFGGLFLIKEDKKFTPSECNFLSVLAGQAAITYENVRLFEELQTAYDDLKQLDHLKSEFTNIAAHELRTPLAILMGYTSVLQDTTGTEAQEYLEIIMRNAMQLRRIMNDLLNMRNISLKQVSWSITEIDMQVLVNQLLTEMSVIAAEKNITLTAQIAENLSRLKGDQQKLETILSNLLTNAIKFTPKAGQVLVLVKQTGDFIECTVADTGIGIPESEYTKIFDRFYQVESSLNRKYEGIGLGLSIVKGLVDICGGQILVDSKENEGSRFSFTIPLNVPSTERLPG